MQCFVSLSQPPTVCISLGLAGFVKEVSFFLKSLFLQEFPIAFFKKTLQRCRKGDKYLIAVNVTQWSVQLQQNPKST